jgi:hypothetical protein
MATVPPHRNLGILRTGEARRQHVGGVQRLLVAQRRWDGDEIVIGVVDKEVFGEVAIPLAGKFIAAEHPAALGTIATLTRITATARGDRTDGDAVPLFTPGDLRPNLIYHADTLMTEQPTCWEGNDASDGMDVRGADERGGRVNHRIVGTGVWDRLLDDTDLADA